MPQHLTSEVLDNNLDITSISMLSPPNSARNTDWFSCDLKMTCNSIPSYYSLMVFTYVLCYLSRIYSLDESIRYDSRIP